MGFAADATGESAGILPVALSCFSEGAVFLEFARRVTLSTARADWVLCVGSPVARWCAAEFALFLQFAEFALDILGFFVHWDHRHFPGADYSTACSAAMMAWQAGQSWSRVSWPSIWSGHCPM